ncbi:MAG: hypothetical protein KAU62_13225 [Candidatus Heimdallarchaeota archaeon]|nr:hypothetical protein [Candidatus Heimdallarchaeota archaeon]MCG3257053.1 hypothetical protein [Candidatus Heimdallarchaeota archaeon]MCK4612113.1 hypothetical protein [Candidatus Heimdallarchaeota archaeon]
MEKMISKKIIVSFLVLSVVATGVTVPILYRPNFSYNIAIDLLREASERIIINNMSITVDAFLWRDFMPVVEEGGTGIYAAITIIATNVSIFPDYLDSDRMWVIYWGAEIWIPEESPPTEIWFTKLEDMGIEQNTLKKRASDGPKWDVGIVLHIVLELVRSNGEKYFLQSHCVLESTY